MVRYASTVYAVVVCLRVSLSVCVTVCVLKVGSRK